MRSTSASEQNSAYIVRERYLSHGRLAVGRQAGRLLVRLLMPERYPQRQTQQDRRREAHDDSSGHPRQEVIAVYPEARQDAEEHADGVSAALLSPGLFLTGHKCSLTGRASKGT